jgi:hypothetical protein
VLPGLGRWPCPGRLEWSKAPSIGECGAQVKSVSRRASLRAFRSASTNAGL